MSAFRPASVTAHAVGAGMLVVLAELLWVAVSVVWLAAAVVHRVAGGRPRLLPAACATVAAAVAALVVMHDSTPWDTDDPFDPHLLTPGFVSALAIVLVGVAAVALGWWALRSDQPHAADGLVSRQPS